MSLHPRYLSVRPLVNWRQQPLPLDLRALFGRRARTTLEIGFGNGEYLVRTASSSPEQNFLGLELEWSSLRRALRRVAREGLTNVRVLMADARLAVQVCLEPGSLDQITILFPCPWPKARHARHRLFSVPFLQLAASRLKPEGFLWIVTDHSPLFEEIQANGATAGLRLATDVRAAGLDTKYERRWSSEGQTRFFETRLYPTGAPVDAPGRIQEVSLRTYRLDHFLPEDWTLPEQVWVEEDLRVQLREVVRDDRRRKAMFRIFTVEENLTQDFWLELTPEDSGWKLQPAAGCAILPTRAIQAALDRVECTLRGACLPSG